MTPEQKAAYVQAQAACATAKIAGMTAMNQQRVYESRPIAYTKEDFMDVINNYGISNNAVLTLFEE